MSQDVTQWVAEVRSLQRQVSELQRSRDQAYASADNLRQMYEAEAQQRRRDNASYSQKIEQLQQTLADSQMPSAAPSNQLNAEINALQISPLNPDSVAQLQAQLMSASRQSQELKAQLEAEQNDHKQTRESLTAALGDAVDLLAKERLQYHPQPQIGS